MACDASQRPSTRIMNDAAEHPASRRLPFGRSNSLGRRSCGERRVQGTEMRVFHPQDFEDFLAGKDVQAAAGGAFDEFAQNEKPHVGVAELLTWRRNRLELGDALPGGGSTLLVIRQRVIRNKPCAMAEQLFDRNLPLAV